MDQEIEQLLLELRNAIANKEWVIARANMEVSRSGFWSCDWNEGMEKADVEIAEILKKLPEE